MSPNRDLRAVVAAAVLLTALALVIPIEWLSLLLLAPVAFALTGYAIFAATFVAQKPTWRRTGAISLGLSLAVLAILPLPLNYLGGLTPATWSLALILVVLLGCGVAVLRRGPQWRPQPLPAPTRPPLAAALIGLASLVLVAAAIVLAFIPQPNSSAVGFTALSLRPVPATEDVAVRVGVNSEEQERTAYRLQVRFGAGRPISRPLVLAPGESKVFELHATPRLLGPGKRVAVRADLFRRGEPDLPYRHVYGWATPAGR